jgi:Cu/Ag efflux protein CusF
MKRTLATFLFAGLAGLLLLSGCAAPKPETHSSTGVIQEVQQGGKVLVIAHQDFPGFMKAMTMPFETVDPKMAEGLKKGDKVAFTLTRQEDQYPITEIQKLP